MLLHLCNNKGMTASAIDLTLLQNHLLQAFRSLICLSLCPPCSGLSHLIMFQTQKGSRRFKRIENRNGVFALLVSFKGHKDFKVVE